MSAKIKNRVLYIQTPNLSYGEFIQELDRITKIGLKKNKDFQSQFDRVEYDPKGAI